MKTWNVYWNGRPVGFVDRQDTLYADQTGNPVIGKLDSAGRFADTGTDLDGQKAALFPFETARSHSTKASRMVVTVKGVEQ